MGQRKGADVDTITDTKKCSDDKDPAIVPCNMNCKYENYSLIQQSGNKTVFLDNLVTTKGQNTYQSVWDKII